MRLSDFQARLSVLMGEALRRGDEDPQVVVFDVYGGRRDLFEVDLDWAPETLEEAEDGTRHPVVRLMPEV